MNLPDGVKAVWDLGKAYRESTATRERLCINGLWLWQPAEDANVVFCQLLPWQFDVSKHNTKRTFRRVSFLTTRLLANMGVAGSTPLLSRFSSSVDAAQGEKRWLDGLYLDVPEDWDDPYRFFRW